MMFVAKKWLQLDSELIREVERGMYNAMDRLSEDDAEKFYQNN